MKCQRCGGDMVVQAVSESQSRGCFSVLIYIILLFIPIIGWIALFMLIKGKKSKTFSYGVCQSCGNKVKV